MNVWMIYRKEMEWNVQVGQLAYDVDKYESRWLWNVFYRLNKLLQMIFKINVLEKSLFVLLKLSLDE